MHNERLSDLVHGLILDIRADLHEVVIDLVTAAAPFYRRVRFQAVETVHWVHQPAGNGKNACLEVCTADDRHYRLGGAWGELRLVADPPVMEAL